jgi:hypothetical protein
LISPAYLKNYRHPWHWLAQGDFCVAQKVLAIQPVAALTLHVDQMWGGDKVTIKIPSVYKKNPN